MQNLNIGDFVKIDDEVIKKASLKYTDGIVLKLNDYKKGDKFPNWKYPLLEPITTALLATPSGEDEINVCWLTRIN